MGHSLASSYNIYLAASNWQLDHQNIDLNILLTAPLAKLRWSEKNLLLSKKDSYHPSKKLDDEIQHNLLTSLIFSLMKDSGFFDSTASGRWYCRRVEDPHVDWGCRIGEGTVWWWPRWWWRLTAEDFADLLPIENWMFGGFPGQPRLLHCFGASCF